MLESEIRSSNDEPLGDTQQEYEAEDKAKVKDMLEALTDKTLLTKLSDEETNGNHGKPGKLCTTETLHTIS